MTIHRIENTNGKLTVITPAGNPARTTASEVFVTENRVKAEEVLAYLTQTIPVGGKRVGAHWLKSTFGVF